jgi:hypothetical protein
VRQETGAEQALIIRLVLCLDFSEHYLIEQRGLSSDENVCDVFIAAYLASIFAGPWHHDRSS